MLTVPKQYQEAANMDFFQYVICTGYQMYLSSVEVLGIFFRKLVLLQFLHDFVWIIMTSSHLANRF